MKQLFTSDYAAWCFLASFLIGIVACVTGWAPLIALAILIFYVSLDVLGYKWIVNGKRTLLVGSNEHKVDVGSEPVHIDCLPFRYSGPADSTVIAYRLIQHGVMIPILAAAWSLFGWQAPVAVLTIWITFGADVLYFLIGKETLPAISDNTYFGYGHWSGPYGWGVWLAAKAAGTPTPPMVAGILYGQALVGLLVAIWMLV